VDVGAIERAAAVFAEADRQVFRVALSPAGPCGGRGPAEERFRCIGPLVTLQQPLAKLICPSIAAGRFATVEAFLKQVSSRRMVQGVQSRVGATIVRFGLAQRQGQWVLMARHHAAGPDSVSREGLGLAIGLTC
jgi:hypothetical protein